MIEGGDGAGKSTLSRGLADAFPGALMLREPGGTPLGEALRDLLLDRRVAPDPWAEVLLFAAARAQLVETVIKPALAERTLVICDRFIDSSVAYQGAGRGLGADAVREVNTIATGGLVADLVVLLDIDPEVARCRKRGSADRMEGESPEFHERVRRCYLDLARQQPARYVVIDASRPPHAVLGEARAAVAGRLA